MAPCIFNSNYSWSTFVFATLELWTEHDCLTHLLISGSKTDVSVFVCDHVMMCTIGGLVSSFGTKIGLCADW
jgi:hypothetical protein